MPVTNRGELPSLLDPVYECLDCGQPISADFMHGLLTRYGWCEDCFGKHVYKASKSEPGICGEPGCGEPYRHQVHIRASAVLGRRVPPPDRAYLRGPGSDALAARLAGRG